MIGVFDSGIGGITVLKELLRELPECSYAYLGDTARVPYGNRGAETIQRYAREGAEFLVRRGCQLLVVACNTMSAVALRELHAAVPRIPIIDVVAPAVDAACAATRNSRIGVIGTRATIASGVYERSIASITESHDRRKRRCTVVGHACPLLVPLVEEGWMEAPVTEAILRTYLEPMRAADVDTLILGCTHYPLLAPRIARVMGEGVTIVNPAAAVARVVRDRLARDTLRASSCRGSRREFILTDRTPHAERIATEWLGMPVAFETAEIAVVH